MALIRLRRKWCLWNSITNIRKSQSMCVPTLSRKWIKWEFNVCHENIALFFGILYLLWLVFMVLNGEKKYWTQVIKADSIIVFWFRLNKIEHAHFVSYTINSTAIYDRLRNFRLRFAARLPNRLFSAVVVKQILVGNFLLPSAAVAEGFWYLFRLKYFTFTQWKSPLNRRLGGSMFQVQYVFAFDLFINSFASFSSKITTLTHTHTHSKLYPMR